MTRIRAFVSWSSYYPLTSDACVWTRKIDTREPLPGFFIWFQRPFESINDSHYCILYQYFIYTNLSIWAFLVGLWVKLPLRSANWAQQCFLMPGLYLKCGKLGSEQRFIFLNSRI
jgi:hypothetical protein